MKPPTLRRSFLFLFNSFLEPICGPRPLFPMVINYPPLTFRVTNLFHLSAIISTVSPSSQLLIGFNFSGNSVYLHSYQRPLSRPLFPAQHLVGFFSPPNISLGFFSPPNISLGLLTPPISHWPSSLHIHLESNWFYSSKCLNL